MLIGIRQSRPLRQGLVLAFAYLLFGFVQHHRAEIVAYEIAAAASGDGPITKRILNLIDDQLHGVVVVYELPGRPERGEDEEGFALIEALIKKKYPAESLAGTGIMIRAVPRPDGSIQVSYLT